MQNNSEYPFEIQVGFSTVIIHNDEERIEFAQTYPELAHKVVLPKRECEHRGIDHRLFWEIKPWKEFEQRRFLAALRDEPEFKQATQRILGIATAGGGQHG